MLGRVDVSGEVLEKKILRDGAKQGTRFFLSLYEAKIVLYILPFSLERKRKKQGEPTNGSPLTPFQRSTGTLSPSIAPAQGDRVCVSHQAEVEKHRAGDVPPLRWGSVGAVLSRVFVFRQFLV